ncbi:MAG: group II intron reverse transcriptase domain-containing protein [Sedimentisphaerales bacterium]|nr:group II intron reverse transcriptase domain-containing protein [Sedimentisphaerales bacterium]
MHSHRHLFERVCTLENLIAAGKAALRGKRMRLPGAAFLADFEKEVFALHEELWAGTYRHGGYTYFTIHEPKERLVAAAPFRDRVVHHAIVRVIEPIFENRFIEDSYACRRGKGSHAAMRRAAGFARRWPYALKCDVRKYFPSIDHEVLTALLLRLIADERLMGLIGHILDTHADGERQARRPGGGLFDVRTIKRGLPIGNLTSQFFANVYLNPVDHFVKHELCVKGYVRYMDDFLMFGDDRAVLRRQGRQARQKLAELRLEIHPDKYWLLSTASGVDFAGYVAMADGRVRVRSSSVRRFDRRYKRMLWDLRGRRVRAAKVTQSVRAWVAHAEHAQSVGLRRSVLAGR